MLANETAQGRAGTDAQPETWKLSARSLECPGWTVSDRDFRISPWRNEPYRFYDLRELLLKLRPTRRKQHHDGYGSLGKVLLILQVGVRGKEYFKAFQFRLANEVPVSERAPTPLESCLDLMVRQRLSQRDRGSLVEQYPHATARLRVVCSNTASTCSRLTPGNHSRNWSTVAPDSRFSNRAATGTRVPRKTQLPLTLSGERSTARQLDQFNITIMVSVTTDNASPGAPGQSNETAQGRAAMDA